MFFSLNTFILDPPKQIAVYSVFVFSFVVITDNNKIDLIFEIEFCYSNRRLGRNLLIFDEVLPIELVHVWCSTISMNVLLAIVVIDGSEVSLAAYNKWIQRKGSTGREGLKQVKLATIQLVNKRVDVMTFSSGAVTVVSKS